MQKVGKKQKIIIGVYLAILVLVAGFIFVYKKGLIYKAEVVPTPQPEAQNRSADFGVYIHFPWPIDQIPEKFTFVIPYSSPSVFDLLRPIRAEIEEFSVFYNAYYFSPDNLVMNAIPWQTWQPLMENNSDWVLWSEPVSEYGKGHYLADPGADGYAEAWADAAIASAQAEQANWVFIDSINQTLLWTLKPGVRPADFKYPENDDTAWRAAITHFLSVVSERARAAGLKVAVNTGTGLGKGFSGNIDAYVDAYMEERFANSRTAYPELMPKNHPASMIDTQITDSQSSNKRLIFAVQANTNDPLYDQRAKFALAMYLIARKTGDVLSLYENNLAYNLHTFWHPDFDAARNLGQILSAPLKVNNVWMRKYEKAIILLNATDSVQNIPSQAGSGSIPARTGMIINISSPAPAVETSPEITPTPSPSASSLTPEPVPTTPPVVSSPTASPTPIPTTSPKVSPTVSPTATATITPTSGGTSIRGITSVIKQNLIKVQKKLTKVNGNLKKSQDARREKLKQTARKVNDKLQKTFNKILDKLNL